jgi:hypothetical protein
VSKNKPPKQPKPPKPLPLFDDAPLAQPEPASYTAPVRSPPPWWKQALGWVGRQFWRLLSGIWGVAGWVAARWSDIRTVVWAVGVLVAGALFLFGVTQCDLHLGPYRVKLEEKKPTTSPPPASKSAPIEPPRDPWEGKVERATPPPPTRPHGRPQERPSSPDGLRQPGQ